jgi:hypothetical protein
MENENLEVQEGLGRADNQEPDVNTGADGGADDGAGEPNADWAGKQEPDAEIYGAPESYDYTGVELPDGMTLDQEILDEFNPIAKKFNLSQASSNELMGLAVKLVQKQVNGLTNGIKEAQQAEVAQYKALLENDKEIGTNKETRDAYLDIADIGYNAVAKTDVKKVLTEKGLNYHPDIIKMFHEIGKLCKEDSLPEVRTPVGQSERAADILYGNRE